MDMLWGRGYICHPYWIFFVQYTILTRKWVGVVCGDIKFGYCTHLSAEKNYDNKCFSIMSKDFLARSFLQHPYYHLVLLDVFCAVIKFLLARKAFFMVINVS